jgi:hypothetical protein
VFRLRHVVSIETAPIDELREIGCAMTPGWHRKDGRTRGLGGGTKEAISALIEVHRHLGPGLMESADEACVCAELAERGIKFERQRALPMMYEGVRLDCGYRLDLVVRGSILLELSKWSEEAHA